MVLVVRGGKFLCWDSYGARWFWGPRHLSEKFRHDGSRLAKVHAQFPDAGTVWAD